MNIYIGNLPLATSSDDLRMLFAEFGRVQTATVVFDRITHRSKRFGFVKMPIRAEADQAMNSLDNKGKAHKRYEFGCKVSVAATSKGGWFLSMSINENVDEQPKACGAGWNQGLPSSLESVI
jgi:RNA recognition motif-containing protein